MVLLITEDGSLIHKNCGGTIGRKRVAGTNTQFLFCKGCNKGVLGNPPEMTLVGTEVQERTLH